MIPGHDSLRPRPRPRLGRGRGRGLGLAPALLAACCLSWQTMNGRPCGRSIVWLCVAALHSAPFGWLVATRVADGLHGLMDLTWCPRRATTDFYSSFAPPHRTSERFWNLPWCIVRGYVSPPQHNTKSHINFTNTYYIPNTILSLLPLLSTKPQTPSSLASLLRTPYLLSHLES